MFFLHEQNAAKSIDYIIDTIPSAHSLDPYLALLKTNGKMVLLGVSTEPVQISVYSLIFGKVKFLSFEIKCRIRRPLLNDVKASSSSNWL
jgi:D-arabinose 1-dehydrogenase-like Zn-dependent alcohol dehydrogenase